MKFEVGKFYKHTTGHSLHVLCEIETTMYGNTLLAEIRGGRNDFMAVGKDEDSTANYHEITKGEWLDGFMGASHIGGYAAGSYMNRCCSCGREFMGDKRAIQCISCACDGVSPLEVVVR